MCTAPTGFSPIDTPALEYAEILLGKGGTESDRQLYRFEDAGGRDVALRFDLTVPLARFAAQHIGSIGTPFKRYHVGPVWRGENTQRGRFREFVQCDFDTIGTTGGICRRRDRPGDPRSVRCPRIRAVHHPRQQQVGPDRPARPVGPGRSRPACAEIRGQAAEGRAGRGVRRATRQCWNVAGSGGGGPRFCRRYGRQQAGAR